MNSKRVQRILSLACIVIAAAVAFAVTGYPDKAYAAGNKTVYVIDGMYEIKATKDNLIYSYKYNKKGLLVKRVENDSKKTTIKYKYNKKNKLTQISAKSGKRGFIQKFAYTSSGKLKSNTTRSTGAKSSDYSYFSFSCNKAGLPVKAVYKYKRSVDTSIYSYNKKGSIVSIDVHFIDLDPDDEREYTESYTFKYDKKGNLKSEILKDSEGHLGDSKITYKNTYKKGRLVKVVEKRKDSLTGKWEKSQPTVYTYKKIKVPSKMVSQIKKQRWAILNQNLNAALGPY